MENNTDPLTLKPSTKRVFHGQTKRLKFTRRSKMAIYNTLIINFDGVIGDVQKYPYFDPKADSKTYMRHGAYESLKSLMQSFQIVIMFNCKEREALSVVRALVKNGVQIDAAYLNLLSREDSTYTNYE